MAEPDLSITIKVSSDVDVGGVSLAVRQAADPRLQAVAFEVEREAKQSMQRGGRAVSGGSGARTRRSSPGQPPFVQTGNLRRNIKTEKSEVGTYLVGPTKAAPYGATLEFLKNRPFMRPALERIRARFASFFKNLPIARTREGRKLNSRKTKR